MSCRRTPLPLCPLVLLALIVPFGCESPAERASPDRTGTAGELPAELEAQYRQRMAREDEASNEGRSGRGEAERRVAPVTLGSGDDDRGEDEGEGESQEALPFPVKVPGYLLRPGSPSAAAFWAEMERGDDGVETVISPDGRAIGGRVELSGERFWQNLGRQREPMILRDPLRMTGPPRRGEGDDPAEAFERWLGDPALRGESLYERMVPGAQRYGGGLGPEFHRDRDRDRDGDRDRRGRFDARD